MSSPLAKDSLNPDFNKAPKKQMSSYSPRYSPLPRSPTREYLELANQRYHCLKTLSRKKQLLILDLNGTLVSRTGSKGMYVRPHQDEFVDYVFENFQVMVWSSAQPVNVDRMCRMFEDHRPELVKVWDRTYFGLTPNQYNKKIVTIKDLKRVWSAFDNGEYDATNTILLDDSPEKTVLQPYNSVHLTSFDHLSSTFRAHGESELLAVISYLEKLRKVDNVCSYIRERPYISPSINLNKQEQEQGQREQEQQNENENELENLYKDNSFYCYHYEFLNPEAGRKMYCLDGSKSKKSNDRPVDVLENRMDSIRL